MKKIEEPRSFGLYINGRRVVDGSFPVETNPVSGRVLGRVFLTAQDNLAFHDPTSTFALEEPTVIDKSLLSSARKISSKKNK